MTQEKFSLLLLILKIYTQLLLLAPFNTLGRQVLLVMDWVPKGTWTEQPGPLWVFVWVRWLWRVLSFVQLQELVLFAPGHRAQRFCECFLPPIPDVSGAFTLQSDQNLQPREWSTWWHFLPRAGAADSPPARQDLQSWHVLPVGVLPAAHSSLLAHWASNIFFAWLGTSTEV